MNEDKQKRLMRTVRNVSPVEPPFNFADAVLRSVRRGETPAAHSRSLADQLTLLFPRLTAAALLVIAVVVVFEFYADGDFVSQLAEASDQWLLPMEWL
jgi:hypothetical protein